MTTDQITIGTQQALSLVQTVTSLLSSFIPAVAALGGPIGLGISAASALLPLLQQLKASGVVSTKEQAELDAKITSIMTLAAFSGPAWQVSGYVPPPGAPTPT